MTDAQKSILIKIASEMARGDGMPFEFVDDWNLPASTTQKVRREIAMSSSRARRKAIQWSRLIMDVVSK
jgi:hypothetical protein